jgi:hypothetical protein
MAELRASDADREQVVAALRRHHLDGRITSDELDERVTAAYAARYVSELGPLLADLPRETAPEPAAPERRRPRAPGRRQFSVTWQAPAPPDAAMADLLQHVAPALRAAGFDLLHRSRERAVFGRRRIPLWVAPIVVFAFPFGLFALLVRTEDRIEIDLVPHGEGTLLLAQGTGPLQIRRAFAELEA